MSTAKEVAIQFAQAMAQRNYTLAYALTSVEYQRHTSLSKIQQRFERIVPHDWGPIAPLLVRDEMLEDWPDKQPDDVGWIYVSLEGEVYPYSEGLFILISRVGDDLPQL